MKQEIEQPKAVALIRDPLAPPPRRLSQVLRELTGGTRGSITVGELREALGDRSFAALLFVFSAINLLPFPPGTSLLLGIPMVIVSFQMAYGARTAWLPRFLLKKSIGPKQLDRMRTGLIPRLERIETVIRPRYWPFSHVAAERIIGLIGLVLSIAVTLPIPLSNWLPAFGATLIALGLMERDGVLLGAGIVVGALSLVLVTVVVGMAGALASVVFG